MSDSLCGDFDRGLLVEKTEYNDTNVIKFLKVKDKKYQNPSISTSTPPRMENILISAVILSSCVY